MTVRSNPKLHAFHQAHDALLRAALEKDHANAARHRDRLDSLAPALEDDDYIQGLYRQALEIADAPNPREQAMAIIEADYRRLRLHNANREVRSGN